MSARKVWILGFLSTNPKFNVSYIDIFCTTCLYLRLERQQAHISLRIGSKIIIFFSSEPNSIYSYLHIRHKYLFFNLNEFARDFVDDDLFELSVSIPYANYDFAIIVILFVCIKCLKLDLWIRKIISYVEFGVVTSHINQPPFKCLSSFFFKR